MASDSPPRIPENPNSGPSRKKLSRRNFLQWTAASALVPAVTPLGGILTGEAGSRSAIPPHLPRRLAICYYGWQWITTALPGRSFWKS